MTSHNLLLGVFKYYIIVIGEGGVGGVFKNQNDDVILEYVLENMIVCILFAYLKESTYKAYF